MSDLTKILGGRFVPPQEKRIDPPEIQLRNAMNNAGIEAPDDIWLDGKIHRFRSGTKGKGGNGDKTGWYCAYGDGVPAGRFGCWRAGLESAWVADIGRDLTVSEQMANTKRMAEARAAREREQARAHEIAEDTVNRIWSEAGAASDDHPYLARKGISAHGARVTGDGRIILPLFSEHGELSSLQYIAADGDKRYHPGGAVAGKFWSIGTADTPGVVYLAEGYATAVSIHEATGRPCVISFSAGNLPAIAEIIAASGSELIIVADNDESGTGAKYAAIASEKTGAQVVMPPIQGDANDYAQSGHDLSALLNPQTDNWLVSADDFSSQPAPVSWLIKHFIQRGGMHMVHGPSGGGKSFLVLDMCMRMAAQNMTWAGNRVSPSMVVYLAGEGHHGLRGRIAAWKQRQGVKSLSMVLSRSGLDLNTPEGYAKTVTSLRKLSMPPELIVIDTLHRFLNGDENSAQDAKGMLDACARLMEEFGCAILLVHHTGVSDEAQHRARGSSAWKGALDIEISVVPGKDGRPIEVIQRKSKDTELADPVYGRLQSVPINGWIDEDGEQVTSAVFEVCEGEPATNTKESKLSKHLRMLESAWWHSGAEDRNSSPYISRSGFVDYLTTVLAMKITSANVYAKAGAPGKPINELLIGGVIEAHEHGWLMADNVVSSAWMMAKSG